MHRIVFTMDTDWISDAALAYLFDEVIDPRLALTIFCTDRYPSAQRRPRTEVALHYNVEKLGFEGGYRHIAGILPEAQGARGHSLAFSERLRAIYRELGTRYDSSCMMYGCQGISPFRIDREVWECPLYFMDAFFLDYHDNDFSRAPSEKDLTGPGLKILDFHPVHLILNTPSLEYYFRCKVHYHDFDALLERRHPGWGIATLFQQWQALALARSCPQVTLMEIVDELNAVRLAA